MSKATISRLPQAARDGAGPVRPAPKSPLPCIEVGALPETLHRAIEVLATRDVYQRGQALVHVVHEPESDEDGIIRPAGTPRIRALRPSVLAVRLHEAARWQHWRKSRRKDGAPELVDGPVPKDVLHAVHELGEWSHVRPLYGVIDYPVLRPDGTVLDAAGYDPQTRLIYEPSVEVPAIGSPTRADAERARKLLEDVVKDFPFATEGAHRAAWLSTILTLLARPAIDGPVPAVIIDASERGTGKTLLANLCGAIVLGRVPAARTTPKDAAEWGKTLLSVAMAADPLIVFDNVKATLDSDALEAVLTSTRFGGRELGKTQDIDLPWRSLVLITANNATLSTDLVRRSLHVRLESPVERPETRKGFAHPNLLQYVQENRPVLLEAGLTILAAYCAAGRPKVDLAPMGSFEAWSDLVRSALVWAGADDPVETQAALRDFADGERSAHEGLLVAWERHNGPRWVTAADLLRDSTAAFMPDAQQLQAALLEFCDDNGRLPNAKKLGWALNSVRDRIVSGLVLRRDERNSATRRYQVVRVAKPAGVPSVPSVDFSQVPRGDDAKVERSESGLDEIHETSESMVVQRAFPLGEAE